MIYLFNPETDLALAHGGASYTPPLKIAATISRLALLPALYAPEGSEILVRKNGMVENVLSSIASIRQIKVVRISEIRFKSASISPWGWNPALRNELVRAGFDDDLPSKETLSLLRDLSHRRTSIEINRILGHEGGTECFSVEDAIFCISQFGKAVVKAPWSSSGRGVWMTNRLCPGETERIVKGVIATQKSVIIEREVNKQIDCATEWICTSGETNYVGMSLFTTDERGKYLGNIVRPQDEIRDMIPAITEQVIEKQKEALDKIIAPYYSGPLGIDMMVSKTGNIVPCVEVNLRMTMGHVALAMWKYFNKRILFSPWSGIDSLGLTL